MSVSEHVRFVINSCAQTIHAIRILRSRGMDDARLQLIYRAVVIAKLNTSSSWWGFTSASDRQRLEGFLRRWRRYGLYPADQPTITEEADKTLFNNVRHNPLYILHPLLPQKIDYCSVLGPDIIILNLPTIMTIETLLIECSFAIPVALPNTHNTNLHCGFIMLLLL